MSHLQIDAAGSDAIRSGRCLVSAVAAEQSSRVQSRANRPGDS